MGKCLKDVLLVVLCFVMPPAAVFVQGGYDFGCQFIINVLLTLLAWAPGTIHALCLLCCWKGRADPDDAQEALLPDES